MATFSLLPSSSLQTLKLTLLISTMTVVILTTVQGNISPREVIIPIKPLTCIPPCDNGAVICTWDDGGNGYSGGEDCQRRCGSPVGNNTACKASPNNTCWWGWFNSTGWACFAGAAPCSHDGDVILSAYMTCAELMSGYGGCTKAADCTNCCSNACHCKDLFEDKSECLCGAK